MIRRLHHLALAAAGLLLAAAAPSAEETPAGADAAPPKIALVRVESGIHPVSAEYLEESVERADQEGVEALVVALSTPGGLLASTRQITQAFLASQTPVVVWVAPSGTHAASAGFFLLMAADIAAMAPGTNTGAAHPVGGKGEDIEGDMGKKVEEDALANIRALARQRGRDEELAAAAVLESRSFTATEALESGLADVIAANIGELAAAIDGREVVKAGAEPRTLATAGAEVVEWPLSPWRQVLAIFVNPSIAYLLMAGAMLGLYIEISNPGAIFPGVVGAICLLLALYSMSLLPVSFAGVAFLVLAFVLLIAETQIPSHGILSIGAVISLIFGSLMLFKDADPALRIATELIVGVAVATSLLAVMIVSRALAVRRRGARTGAEGMLEQRGTARSDLSPTGTVFVHGELWRAVAAEPVPAGAPVIVTGLDGLTLQVRPAEPK